MFYTNYFMYFLCFFKKTYNIIIRKKRKMPFYDPDLLLAGTFVLSTRRAVGIIIMTIIIIIMTAIFQMFPGE